jgi:predicted nucleic acid-binding Zn ribbon protein
MSRRRKNPEYERKSEPTSLKSAMSKMFDVYDIKKQLAETNITESWEELMGSTVASRTSKLFVKDKKLFVRLTSAPLAHEMSIAKPKILQRFSEKFGPGAIEDIVFI